MSAHWRHTHIKIHIYKKKKNQQMLNLWDSYSRGQFYSHGRGGDCCYLARVLDTSSAVRYLEHLAENSVLVHRALYLPLLWPSFDISK